MSAFTEAQVTNAKQIATMMVAQMQPPTTTVYIPGENIDVRGMSVDSPAFWKGWMHSTCNQYQKSFANLAMARAFVQPDEYGFVSQDNLARYFESFIQSAPQDHPMKAYANNAVALVALCGKYFEYDHDSMAIYTRFCAMTGLRLQRKYNTPTAVASVVRSALSFYMQNPDIAAETKKNIANAKDLGEKIVAYWNPFFVMVGTNFPYSSLAQLFTPNWKAFNDTLGVFYLFPEVLHPLRKLSTLLGFSMPQMMQDSNASEENFALFINNQIYGRLMQRESVGALIVFKRMAAMATEEGKGGTAKLALFFWHAMMEVKENPNSGWKQSIDDNFKQQFEIIAANQYKPRMFFWKGRLYGMLGLPTSTAGTAEWAAAFFDMLVWGYQLPANATDLMYYKNVMQSDSSPGKFATFLDMLGSFWANMRQLNDTGVFVPGTGFAAGTPQALTIALFEHSDTPVFQAAAKRWMEFWGLSGGEEDIANRLVEWKKAMADKYQANVERMFPALANL